MASPRSAGEIGPGDGADAVGSAFQLEPQRLAQLQEALRLQEQEAERKVQEAERRMQEALRLQEERAETALREMERKLQEKDAAITDIQQQLQEAQEGTAASERSSVDGSQRVESRDGGAEIEDFLQSAMETFVPQIFEALFRTLEEQSPNGRVRTGGAAVGGGEEPPSSTPSPTSSGAGHQGATADEEERARQRVERRVREVELRIEAARRCPCPLGEQLCEAAYEGRLSDVQRLVDSGANVNYTDSIGYTPLHNVVLRAANPHVMSLLLRRGADVNAVTSVGNSALHWAAKTNFDGSCLDMLLWSGADVNARNVHGETPLKFAVESNNTMAAFRLLKAGARKDLRPWGGFEKNQTPFDLATSPYLLSILRD